MYLLVLVLSGCTAIPANEEAKSVRIVPPNYDLKECEFVKVAYGLQGNIISYWFTSNDNLVVGAMNNLRNKALQAGGNVIIFEDDREVDFGTSTVFMGYIYRCK